MHCRSLAVLAPLATALCFAVIDDPARIQCGMVAGAPGADPAVKVYKGIPYAAPPVGSLRWK